MLPNYNNLFQQFCCKYIKSSKFYGCNFNQLGSFQRCLSTQEDGNSKVEIGILGAPIQSGQVKAFERQGLMMEIFAFVRYFARHEIFF